MGMYSFFYYEHIEVKNFKKAKDFIISYCEALSKKDDKGNYPEGSYAKMFMEMIDEENKTLTFAGWDNIKLISYWYLDEVLFLNAIAKYIEGRVEWDFESKDEAGYVLFTDGKCEIITGLMNWNESSAEDFFDRKELKTISPELKKLLVMEKLK